MVAYLEGAGSLFVAAAEKALAAADCKTNDVDIIVTVSSTGIATPSLEARVASRMGFRADVERVPVSNLQSSLPSCPASQHPAASRHTARA
jgi:alkylresorcinol/alkylpyrone synthase